MVECPKRNRLVRGKLVSMRLRLEGIILTSKNPSTQLEQSIPSPEEVIRKTSDCLTRSRQILLEIEELLK